MQLFPILYGLFAMLQGMVVSATCRYLVLRNTQEEQDEEASAREDGDESAGAGEVELEEDAVCHEL